MSTASDEDDPTAMALVSGEPPEARLIRCIVQPIVKVDMLIAMPSAAVPSGGQRILTAVYALPPAFLLATRLLTSGGAHPGWRVLIWLSLLVEGGILYFRKPLRRQIERAAVRWTLRAGRTANAVSLEGIVVADVVFESELSGRRAVLVRARRKDPSRGLVYDSLEGVDFTIESTHGIRYAVAPSEHLYFDEPPPDPDDEVLAAETLLCAGDRVHVWGTAVSEPWALGERADLRSPPMRLALVGSKGAPLVIRFVKSLAIAPGAAQGRQGEQE